MGDKLGYFRVTLPRSRMNTAKESAFYQLFPTQRRKRHASVHTANCMPYFPFSSKILRNYSLQQACGTIPVPHHSLVIL